MQEVSLAFEDSNFSWALCHVSLGVGCQEIKLMRQFFADNEFVSLNLKKGV